MNRSMEMELRPRESFSPEEHREHKVFETLLSMVPGLDARLSENLNDENDFRFVASMVCHPFYFHIMEYHKYHHRFKKACQGPELMIRRP